MSFFLKRGSSFTELSNVRKRLPGPEEVFREGYVHRKVTVMLVSTFMRNFCILQHGELSFHSSWESLRDDSVPIMSCKINQHVTVSYIPKKSPGLQVECPDWPAPLHMHFETEEDAKAWKFILELEVKRQNGHDIYPPPVRSRFFEGPLFKTPPEADKWEERWFQLTGEGELSYRQSLGSNKKGVIDLETCKIIPNKTDAPGICTPFFFQIHTFTKEESSGLFKRRVFNLSAPTQIDYLNWLKALQIWMDVKRPPPLGLAEGDGVVNIFNTGQEGSEMPMPSKQLSNVESRV
jgi:hypothetical protein